MYGFEAISANNGWAMAFAGALIVVSGLAVLATVISQLHRVAALFERPRREPAKPSETPSQKPTAPPRSSFSIETEVHFYRELAEPLGDAFELRQLYQSAAAAERPHIHLTIRSLRERGFLVPDDQGKFTWKNQ